MLVLRMYFELESSTTEASSMATKKKRDALVGSLPLLYYYYRDGVEQIWFCNTVTIPFGS